MISEVHPKDVKKEFLNKLESLLGEYQATISFSVSPCSDTHGLNDEKLVISSSLLTKNQFNEEIWFETYGWSIDHYDFRN